eukprot:m.53179 g.53179  ORF g.53179 m.53179 type:complete len:138 (-) comp21720_c0_seq1:968-1381(-)
MDDSCHHTQVCGSISVAYFLICVVKATGPLLLVAITAPARAGGTHGDGHGGTCGQPPLGAKEFSKAATRTSFFIGGMPLSEFPATVSNKHEIQHSDVMLFGCGHALQQAGRTAIAALIKFVLTHDALTFRVMLTTLQ